MDDIKLSIIIPVYNVEKYIDECIRSAVNQTLKEIEVIIIDDGSTDNSIKIIKDYEAKYSNIIVVSNINEGVSVSRNIGLDRARGEYIFFLDSDDYIDLELGKDLYKLAKSQNLDMIHFDANVIYEEEFEAKNNPYDRSKIIKSTIYSGEEFYQVAKKSNGYRAQVCTYMYKTEFLKKNKLSFHQGILHEDELFTTKAIILANRILYIPQKYFFRRMRKGSIMTSRKSTRNILGYYTVAEQLYNIFINNSTELSITTKKILLRTIAGHYGYCNRLFLKLPYKDLESYKIIKEINESVKAKLDVYNRKHLKLILIINIIQIYIFFNFKYKRRYI